MPEPILDPSIAKLTDRLTPVDKALTLAILASLATDPSQLPQILSHFVQVVADAGT